jgi:hypothetical protein
MKYVLLALLVLTTVTHAATAQSLRLLPARPPERLDDVVAGQLKIRLRPEASLHNDVSAVVARYGLMVERAYLPYAQSLQAQLDAATVVQRSTPSARALMLDERLRRSYVVRYDTSRGEPERMARMLVLGCTDIEVAEPVTVGRLTGEPNDSLVSQQPMLTTIRAFDAWDVEGGDTLVLIGISDSGVLQEHEDLAPSLHTNWREVPNNGVDDDNNGYIDDYRGYNFGTALDSTAYGNTFNKREGHGTGVAGICGAAANNGIGIAGVAGACRMVPLKTMPDNINGILYGYESIMYCALNGIHVVNCSWGGFSKSCIDEDVIAYAVERGTAVVAAAGNHGTTAPFYPAAYEGVLSVGVTDPEDNVIGMSGRGAFVDVMAPGQRTLTTGNDGGYGGFCCTSGSAPIVSGIVGLVRSKHPTITPAQACAMVRTAVDDIGAKNAAVADLIPGRVNVLRAVTLPPDSIPALRVASTTIARNGGGRWGPGDDVEVRVALATELAELRDARAALDVVGPAADAIALQTTNVALGSIVGTAVTGEQTITTARVLRDVDTMTFIRMTVTGTTLAGEEHRQTLLLPIVPAPPYLTLQNDVLSLSVGDRGRLGWADVQRGLGDGVRYKTACGLLYEAGLIVSTGQRVVDNIRAGRGTNDHFRPEKPFRDPTPSLGIVTDADAPDSMRLDVRVTQQVSIASADTGVVVNDIIIENISDTILSNVALGWFFDWDLGSLPSANVVRAAGSRATMLTSRRDAPAVTVALSSPYTDVRVRVVGVDNTITYSAMPPSMKDSLLRADGSYVDTNDVAIVARCVLDQPLRPGERKLLRMVISIDDDSARSTAEADARINTADVRVPPSITVYPQPSSDRALVSYDASRAMADPQGAATVTLDIYDNLGRHLGIVASANVGQARLIIPIDLRSLPSGTYALKATLRGQSIMTHDVVPLVIVR